MCIFYLVLIDQWCQDIMTSGTYTVHYIQSVSHHLQHCTDQLRHSRYWPPYINKHGSVV